AIIKIFLGNFPRDAAVRFIAGVQITDCGSGLIRIRKGKNAFTALHPFRESCLLRQNGPAIGEVTTTAFTKPSAVADDIPMLGNAEFSLRSPDKPLVSRGFDRDRERITE